jgi:hypothetical protein
MDMDVKVRTLLSKRKQWRMLYHTMRVIMKLMIVFVGMLSIPNTLIEAKWRNYFISILNVAVFLSYQLVDYSKQKTQRYTVLINESISGTFNGKLNDLEKNDEADLKESLMSANLPLGLLDKIDGISIPDKKK